MGFPGNQRPQKSLSSPTWFQVYIKALGSVISFLRVSLFYSEMWVDSLVWKHIPYHGD